jgi:hypothetical protein
MAGEGIESPAGSAAPPAGDRSDRGGARPPAGTESGAEAPGTVQTSGERRAGLDQELDESLQDFDGMLQKEQEALAKRREETAAAAAAAREAGDAGSTGGSYGDYVAQETSRRRPSQGRVPRGEPPGPRGHRRIFRMGLTTTSWRANYAKPR